MGWLLALLLATPAAAEIEVVAETVDFAGGPHCGIMHVVGGARLRVVEGPRAGKELVALISCPEMSHQPVRQARYRLTRTRPKSWPASHLAQRLIRAGEAPWYQIEQVPLWERGFGHFVGRAVAAVGTKKLPFAYTTTGGRIDSVTVEVPGRLRGPRAAAIWMGYPPRKGLSPVKRGGAWVWPAGDPKRRLAEGVEGRLKDGRFTVRRR